MVFINMPLEAVKEDPSSLQKDIDISNIALTSELQPMDMYSCLVTTILLLQY